VAQDVLAVGPDARDRPGPDGDGARGVAAIEGTPVKISAGNVKKLPPPATELITPAMMEEPERSRAWLRVMKSGWSQKAN